MELKSRMNQRHSIDSLEGLDLVLEGESWAELTSKPWAEHGAAAWGGRNTMRTKVAVTWQTTGLVVDPIYFSGCRLPLKRRR